MPDTRYGTAQRVAFAGLVIGAIFCTIGVIAPYWQKGSVSVNTFTQFIGEKIPFIGDIKLAKFYGGIWWYCFEVPVANEHECHFYSLDSKDSDDGGRDWAIRLASAVNVIVAILCSSVALCRTCCCGGGKTICHGIMAFIAGTAGIIAVGIFAAAASEGFAMKVKLMEFGWAFYMSAAGAGLITVVSFILCFATPENPLTPIIISHMNRAVPNSYMRMQDTEGPPTASAPFVQVTHTQQPY